MVFLSTNKSLKPLLLIASLVVAAFSTNAVAATVVIDFQTGAAGAGGTITESGGNVIGSDINISLLILDGTASSDGSYTADALMNFDTAANTITIVGTVDPFVATSQTLLSGSFDSFSYSVVGGNEFFTGTGPDIKSCALLCEIGVDPNTPFEFFGISIESVNGTVISTDIVNTAVPVPAAVWLFGSGLIGLVGIARRKEA